MLSRKLLADSVSKLLSSKRMMSSSTEKLLFKTFNVTEQVFHTSPKSFAFVNLKPLLTGHVLVSPKRVTDRMTDLTADEVTDLFTTVQRVQRMLAKVHFEGVTEETLVQGLSDKHGSFNVAMQDGVDAGQTIPHVHVHIIPRPAKPKERNPGDEIYAEMNSEKGNIGGALYDRERPGPGGAFPKIEEASREARSAEVMKKEAEFYRSEMEKLEGVNQEAAELNVKASSKWN